MSTERDEMSGEEGLILSKSFRKGLIVGFLLGIIFAMILLWRVDNLPM